jgi:hypothetical protein
MGERIIREGDPQRNKPDAKASAAQGRGIQRVVGPLRNASRFQYPEMHPLLFGPLASFAEAFTTVSFPHFHPSKAVVSHPFLYGVLSFSQNSLPST